MYLERLLLPQKHIIPGTTYRSWRSVHPFLHSLPFYQSPKFYQILSNSNAHLSNVWITDCWHTSTTFRPEHMC